MNNTENNIQNHDVNNPVTQSIEKVSWQSPRIARMEIKQTLLGTGPYQDFTDTVSSVVSP